MKMLSRCLLCCMLLTLPALALVDPAPTTLPVQPWMADIEVRVGTDPQSHVFCKGVLIAPQWILSTGLCLADPNHYLDTLYPGDDPHYFVKLGPNADVAEVEKFFTSADYRIGLFRMALASEAQALPLSGKTAKQLWGSQVFILGKQTSQAIYNPVYNPGVSADAVSCKINGTEFFLDGAICYLLATPVSGTTLYQSSATVIDPLASGAPATALDKLVNIDTSGAHLYLDFRSQRSYPCLEDLGAPVLSRQSDGSYEIAGIVAGVGMSVLLPLCGMSLANEFISVTAIRTFADQTMAAYDFSARCPKAPEPAVTYLDGGVINLHWGSVKNATGYKLHYTTRHGHVPIETANVLDRTTISTTLEAGRDYLVAVSAYNSVCSSALSRALPLKLPQ